MGAYLSQPVKTKQTESGENDTLDFGATAMQGWRVSQEDAHNCMLNFDNECSYFAVYDGHGGAEVSEYAAKSFPDFLKNSEAWCKGRYGQALEDAFIKFDETLTNSDVLDELKRIAGIKKDETNDEDSETNEDKALLLEEACLPLEDVLKKYGIRVRVERGEKNKFLSPKINTRKKLVDDSEVAAEDALPTSPSSQDQRDNVDKSSTNKPNFKRARNGKVKSFLVNDEIADENKNVDAVAAEEEEPPTVVKRIKQDDDNGEESVIPAALNDEDSCKLSSANEPKVKENGYLHSSTNNVDDGRVVAVEQKASNENGVSTTEECNSNGEKGASSELVTETVEQMFKKKDNSDIDNVPVVAGEDESDDGDNEDEEYQEDLDDDDDSSGETGEEESVDDEEIVEEEIEMEGVEDEEEEEDDDDEMFPVPSGETPGVDSGTTACIAIVKGNTIYVANAGDSRCVLCRHNDVAVDLSADHKPEDTKEKERIENAGGKITGDGRVNGGLNLSRAIGDHFYKKNTNLELKDQMITALPDVRVETLLPTDKFMVLACDGIWNSMSSQEVVDFVSLRLKNGQTTAQICEQLCDWCLAPSTAGDGTGCDNMTAIIVQFKEGTKNLSQIQEQSTNSLNSSDAAPAVPNDCNDENT